MHATAARVKHASVCLATPRRHAARHRAPRRAERRMIQMSSSTSSSSSSSSTPRKSIAVVSGANTGIGYETVKALLSSGAYDEIILACRDEEKALKACARLRADVGGASLGNTDDDETSTTRLTCERLDLASLESVRACGDRLNARAADAGIDCLILNAPSAMPSRRSGGNAMVADDAPKPVTGGLIDWGAEPGRAGIAWAAPTPCPCGGGAPAAAGWLAAVTVAVTVPSSGPWRHPAC